MFDLRENITMQSSKQVFLLIIPLVLSIELEAQEEKKPIILSAYAEVYYLYNFNKPLNNTQPPFIYNFNRNNDHNTAVCDCITPVILTSSI